MRAFIINHLIRLVFRLWYWGQIVRYGKKKADEMMRDFD